jgi:hypothetical protein
MWGERGLVSSFLLDLRDNPARWESFLRRTSLSQMRDWSRLSNVWCVVEPNFGNRAFGSPDAVVRVRNGAEDLVILVEAKLGTCYEESLNRSKRGRTQFNSSLNGQIELNHRLAIALSKFRNNNRLEEPGWLAAKYGEANCPRFLLKPEVLRRLCEPLSGLSTDQYLHLALTSDRSNPYLDSALEALWPEIYDDESLSGLHRVGWIGWEMLRELAASWDGRTNPSNVFLSCLSLNEDYLRLRDLAAELSMTSPGRSSLGVSMIYARDINPSTYLHLSWRKGSCAIRNYSTGDVPRVTRHPLAKILPKINDEIGYPWNDHPAISDVETWTSITSDLNSKRGFGGLALDRV